MQLSCCNALKSDVKASNFKPCSLISIAWFMWHSFGTISDTERSWPRASAYIRSLRQKNAALLEPHTIRLNRTWYTANLYTQLLYWGTGTILLHWDWYVSNNDAIIGKQFGKFDGCDHRWYQRYVTIHVQLSVRQKGGRGCQWNGRHVVNATELAKFDRSDHQCIPIFFPTDFLMKAVPGHTTN